MSRKSGKKKKKKRPEPAAGNDCQLEQITQEPEDGPFGYWDLVYIYMGLTILANSMEQARRRTNPWMGIR